MSDRQERAPAEPGQFVTEEFPKESVIFCDAPHGRRPGLGNRRRVGRVRRKEGILYFCQHCGREKLMPWLQFVDLYKLEIMAAIQRLRDQ